MSFNLMEAVVQRAKWLLEKSNTVIKRGTVIYDN